MNAILRVFAYTLGVPVLHANMSFWLIQRNEIFLLYTIHWTKCQVKLCVQTVNWFMRPKTFPSTPLSIVTTQLCDPKYRNPNLSSSLDSSSIPISISSHVRSVETWHDARLSHWHDVILSYCHTVIVSYCHTVILVIFSELPYFSVESWHDIRLSYCHDVILPYCHRVILSCCHTCHNSTSLTSRFILSVIRMTRHTQDITAVVPTGTTPPPLRYSHLLMQLSI